MKAFHGAALALVLALTACGDDGGAGNASANMAAPPQLTQVEAPNGDWTQIVQQTPEGGYRMGNPNAPVKLVEYASLGCHVCQEFSEQGSEELTNQYVKSGQVSWEFRPFLIFPTDPAMTMLLQCQGPQAFFRSSEQLYAQQSALMDKVRALPPAELQRIQALPPEQQSAAMVRAAGLDQFFRQRGMPEARVNSCLADQGAIEKLVAVTNDAVTNRGVTGTPTFFINDKVVPQTSNWATLEPALREAIGG